MSDRNEFKTSGNVGQRTAGTRESNVSDKRDIFGPKSTHGQAPRLIALAGDTRFCFTDLRVGEDNVVQRHSRGEYRAKYPRNDIAVVSNEFRVMAY